MKKIILIPSPKKDTNFRVARSVILRLRSQGAKVFVDKKYRELIWDEVETFQTPPSDADLCIVMGGDGSFLDAAPFVIEHSIPLLGINLGRVGFLPAIEPDKLSHLDKLFKKKPKLAKHILLEVTVQTAEGEKKTCGHLAVNDVVLCCERNMGLAEFSLSDQYENGIFYRADGMILSTPTGSSAYSLSAGGPLIENSVEAICATPICAHSFFNRPILFGMKSTVTLRNESERGVALILSVDGRAEDRLLPGDEAIVTVSQKHLFTVEYPNSGMLSTLRRKMEAAELKKDT